MNNKGESTLKKCKERFKLERYSKNTSNCYTPYIEEFLLSQEKSAAHLNKLDIENYISNYNYTSPSQQNQIVSALKFLYFKVLNKKNEKINFIRPIKTESLPNIIPENYLKETLDKIKNIKHRAILHLSYSIALRSGDVRKLELSNIRSNDMKVRIQEGKGKKDAYLPLTQTTLNILRLYYNEYKPKKYLFEGQKEGNQYSPSSLNKIVKKYFGEEYHFHNIRHSTATHLLDKGVDISFIQKLLRHKELKTTLLYLRITTQSLSKLPLY